MKNLNALTDEELALAYIDGDNSAFDELLSRNQGKLFSYILFVVRDEDKANDLFQETFVKVITKLHEKRYVDSGKFSAWIMRIAHNVMMDWYREQRARNLIELSEENNLSNLSKNDILEINVENRYVNDFAYRRQLQYPAKPRQVRHKPRLRRQDCARSVRRPGR